MSEPAAASNASRPPGGADTARAVAAPAGLVLSGTPERDARFMQLALDAAHEARAAGEVPVGALVVRGDEVIAVGANRPIGAHDPCAHAEIIALRAAAAALSNYRLPGCELYVTLEPCLMCAGAIMHARISRVVFGARDPKTGVCGSVINAFDESRLNHHTVVAGGILDAACAALLRDFFAGRRAALRRARDEARAASGASDEAAPSSPGAGAYRPGQPGQEISG
jgi:tRNA(adenine34) deaminase